MYQLTSIIGDAIFAHAKSEYIAGKRESCGVIVRAATGDQYRPCVNIFETPTIGFRIDPRDLALAEDAGEIVAIVHSHPDASANPTDADILYCNKGKVPWLIIGMPDGVIVQCQPNKDGLPLLGRQFHHGVVDCYTLVQDYYKQVLGIELPHFTRQDEWWVQRQADQTPQQLYRDNFDKADFVEVGRVGEVKIQKHDVILMTILSNVENHAVVIDDANKGTFLHHLYNRLSNREVWGGYWERHATSVFRHKTLQNNE